MNELQFHCMYRRGHPAGWTDDLGIIADRNQYISSELAGWYALPRDVVNLRDLKWVRTVRQWCDDNLTGYWNIDRAVVYINDDDDATLFRLTWS